MWQALALASAGGGVVALLTWQLAGGFQQHQAARRLARRLKALAPPARAVAVAMPLRPGRYSSLPMIRRLIAPLTLAPRLALFLEQAGSRLNVSSFLILHLCGVILGFVVASWAGAPGWLVAAAALAGGGMPSLAMVSRRQRRLQRFSEQLPDAIRLIASSLRAGLGLDAGLEIVANELPEPIRGEFRKLLNEAFLEADPDRAFRRLGQRVPTADVRLFGAAACLHREIGGNFAALLDQLEENVRERFHRYRELKTLTAESRLTGWVLGLLPLVVGAGLVLFSPGYLQPLLWSHAGRTVLWTAVGLQGVGAWVIWWLVHPKIQ